MIKRLLPRVVKKPLGRVLQRTQNEYWKIRFGSNNSLVPPLELMHDGPQSFREFKQNGDEFLRHYINLCGLRPDDRVLDVGSGIGRKTLPLVNYLSERGGYDGLELVKSGVEWCSEKYTTRYPNFRFHLIDVHNDLYNPTGKYKPEEYQFPFADEQFTFVVLNSVFTHMRQQEVEHYLSEIARVLEPRGRCLISFFLINQESLRLIQDGRSTIDLSHEMGSARVVSETTPEIAIGYDEDYINRLYNACGLEIQQPISYGSWCGRSEYLSYQDQVVASKVR